jgi:hypothetical protein
MVMVIYHGAEPKAQRDPRIPRQATIHVDSGIQLNPIASGIRNDR